MTLKVKQLIAGALVGGLGSARTLGGLMGTAAMTLALFTAPSASATPTALLARRYGLPVRSHLVFGWHRRVVPGLCHRSDNPLTG